MLSRQLIRLVSNSTAIIIPNSSNRALSTFSPLNSKATPPSPPTPSTIPSEEESIKTTSSTEPLSSSSPLPPSTTPSTPTKPTESVIPVTSLAQSILDLTPDQTGSIPESKFERTGARAKGSGSKSSIEQKRQNLTRFLLLSGLFGTVGVIGYLGREWDDDFERMKLVGRTEDLEAVRESEMGGWKGALGRGKIRGEDILDVGFSFFPSTTFLGSFFPFVSFFLYLY